MEHRIAWLDVFAEEPLAGNGLAVVADADAVGDDTMLALAQEMRLSETTFVQSCEAREADYRNRIWTPRQELPFAGHPSLGTAVAVARWRGLDEATFVQETEAGLQPIDVRRDEDHWDASMLQNPAEEGDEADAAEVAVAAGLEPSDAHPELSPRVVSTGLPHLIAPLASPDVLARAAPDMAKVEPLLSGLGIDSLYLFAPEAEAGRARSRCFVTGIGEDPATGSAAGPLGAYLFQRLGWERLVIRQGEEMGRPSVLRVEMERGRPRVSGGVVPLIDGEISLP